MGIFKKLSEQDYQVTPFRTHKTYTYSGHNSGSGIYWLEGYDMGIETFAPNATITQYLSSVKNEMVNEPTNSYTEPTDQYHFKRTVWNSINQLYYKFAKEPGKSSGPNKLKTYPFYGESLGERGLKYQERFLGSSVVVISVPQQSYGESIKKGSVILKDTENNITLYDDGYGNLYDSVVNTGSAVSDTGLVGWWSFDEQDTYRNGFITGSLPCTKVKDQSLNGISSIVSGSPTFESSNISSSAGLYFGGEDLVYGTKVSESVDFPYHEVDKRMNIRAVSFFFTGSSGDMIHLNSSETFNTASAANHSWKIELNEGYIKWTTVIRSGSLESNVYSSSLSTNNASYSTSGLHHCVCQINNGMKEMYVDGEKQVSESIVITEMQKKANSVTPGGTIVEIPRQVPPYLKKLDNFRLGDRYTGYLDEVRFYNRTLGSDEISSLNLHPTNQNFVGNVFYSQGLITVTNREQKYRNSFRNPAESTIRYKGDYTIYEHEITCAINKGEFSHTLNRSARMGWDSNSEVLRPELTGSKFSPYVTTIGIYDDEYNLIAIGKLSEPMQNDPDVEITFVVRFDA